MIVNFTRKSATSEQVAEGVIDLEPDARGYLVRLLDYDEAHKQSPISRVGEIVLLAHVFLAEGDTVLIDGPLCLLPILEVELEIAGFCPVVAVQALAVG